MNITIDNILFIGAILLFISIVAGKTSYKFGVPVLVLFLGVGMLAGSEGVGGIHFNHPKQAQFIGIVSLNFILFSGGLGTSWKTIRPVIWQGVALSTVGVLLTAVSLGVFVWYFTDFSIYEGLLLGAIVSSTDAAAVFSILRSKSIALKNNLRPTLELESGSNDPMAYVLTIAFLSLVVNPEKELWTIIPFFFQQMLIGALAGLLFGRVSKFVINEIRLDFEGLYPVLAISMMFITFSVTDFLGGNGFLAVYLCAVYLGNQQLIHKNTVIKVYDGLAWLVQISLFLTLGLQVFPSHVLPLMGIGVIISLFLIFVARPLGILISLLPFRMKMRRRLYVSWVGLRGAVPIVFATYPLIAGIDKADTIFNIVFFVSLTSILIQGTTLSVFAKWLKVALPESKKPKKPLDQLFAESPKANMVEIYIDESCPVIGKKILELQFPKTAIIAMIHRGDKFITPNGGTEIQEKDLLVVLSDKRKDLYDVYDCLGVAEELE